MSFLPLDKLTIIRKTISLSFFLGILLSFKLWHSDRLFPLIPAVDFLPNFSPTINYIILGSFLISLVLIFFSENKKWIVLSLSILLILLLQDQMRWQPWVYTYILILIPFLFKNEENTATKKINYLQIIFIGIYVWGGIHKLNPNFTELIFRSVLVDLFNINNQSISDSFLQIGYSIPIIEILIGIALIFPQSRKIGVQIAIVSHLFIMLYIYSFGALSNSVVYPWNVAMILCVYMLFYNTKNNIVIWRESNLKYRILNYSILFVIGVLPILNFANSWDTYFSFSMYSAKPKNYYILIKDDEQTKLDTSVYQEYYKTIDGMSRGKIINMTLWSYKELNVPMNPEKRIFKKVGESFCNSKDSIIFTAFELPLWNRNIFKETKNQQSSLHFLKFEKPLNLSAYESFTCTDLEN